MRAHFKGIYLVRSSRLHIQSKHTYNDPCLCIGTSLHGWENRPTPRLSCSPAGPSPSTNIDNTEGCLGLPTENPPPTVLYSGRKPMTENYTDLHQLTETVTRLSEALAASERRHNAMAGPATMADDYRQAEELFGCAPGGMAFGYERH